MRSSITRWLPSRKRAGSAEQRAATVQAVRAQERAEHERRVGITNGSNKRASSAKRPSSGRFPGGGACMSSHSFVPRPSTSGKLAMSPAAAGYSASSLTRFNSASASSGGSVTPGRGHGSNQSGASNGSGCTTASGKSKCLRFADATAAAPSARSPPGASTPRHGADAARKALEGNRFAVTAVGPCMSEQI